MAMSADIGILTLYDRINYGALLQTYALQEYLAEKGHSVEVVDYRPAPPNGGKSVKQLIRSAVWSHTLKPLLRDKNRLLRSDEFRTGFIRLASETCLNSHDLVNQCGYGTMIVGSDQVWNPNLIGHDKSWFLDFPDCKNRVSYAASFGLSQLPEEFEEEFYEGVGKMQSVSVREETGASIVEGLIGARPTVVMDPIFLIDANKWRELMVPPQDRGHVLCYYMPGFPKVEAKIKQLADEFAKTLGLKVRNIGKRETSRLDPRDPSVYGVGPREFLGLIDGAELVITNSFHGTAFSLLLNKPFYSVVDSSAGAANLASRMTDLLARLGADEHIVTTSSTACGVPSALEPSARNALATEINASKEFLADALRRNC